jgi:methionyl-tRNA formyltransferase
VIKNIVIASPYSRHDYIGTELGAKFNVMRIKSPEALTADYLKELNPTYVFFPHWSWIIPDEILDDFQCVVFHMTDLPYGRGGSPLQNLIVRGIKETVVSAIKCVKELDAGPIYLKMPLTLEGTAQEILDRASIVIQQMIIKIVDGQAVLKDQVGNVVSFKRRVADEGDLSHLETTDQIYDHIRMLDADNYPSAFIKIDNFRLDFSSVKNVDGNIEAVVRFYRSDK